MAITTKEVEYVARLARLRLSEDEKERITQQLDQTLDYVQQLNQLDTKDVPPTSHVLELKNVWREDQVQPSLPLTETLANAPQSKDEFFVVPKVIEG
ncbi:MAG: Asp-tRNA(Asn)/Glu-tRNA(Gln) amidotransferase subunit GatC [Candidatus Schekmanbacteria bacterium]|nr:Asp-tRNA(Asn)/Glu-tRNA(Gln) amidotransferase subunit GatC [Candidatus Schekmanbacteria bacterium]